MIISYIQQQDVCLFVCNLSPPKRLDRLSTSVPHYLRLGQGKVIGKKYFGSIHRFAGNPRKTGFYSSLYITLYYKNRMSSNCETAKPIEYPRTSFPPSWSGEGFRPKRFRIHLPVRRKSGKNRFLQQFIYNAILQKQNIVYL